MAEGRVIRIVADAEDPPVFYWQGYLDGQVQFASTRTFEDRADAKENAEEIFCDHGIDWIIDNEDL